MQSVVLYRKPPLITREAMELLSTGRERHRDFQILTERGILTETRHTPNLFFNEYDPNTTMIPSEAKAIMKEVEGHPIKQWVIGHEYPIEVPVVETPKRVDQQISTNKGLEFVVGLLSILILGPFIAIASAFSLLTTVAVLDPCLVAVLSDINGQETWVCLATWDEVSS